MVKTSDFIINQTLNLGEANGLSLNGTTLSLALATDTTPGALSSADFIKLKNLDDNVNPLTIGTANGLVLNNQELSLNLASTSANGAMSSADFIKLAGIEIGAETNAVDSVNGETGVVVLDSGDIAENTNLYYTEERVSANVSVAANTAKVSADGSVTTHSDITDAGSGKIITETERNMVDRYTRTRFPSESFDITSSLYAGNQQIQLFNIRNPVTFNATETGFTFAKYDYTVGAFESTNSSTFVADAISLYEISYNANNKTFNVYRRPAAKDSIEVQATAGNSLTQNYNTTAAAGIAFIFDTTRIPALYGQIEADLTNNTLTIKRAGRYSVGFNASYRSTGQRVSLEAFVTQNGTSIDGKTYGGYVRGTNGHLRSSIGNNIIIDAEVDDVIQVRLKRAEESTVGTAAVMLPGAHISVIRI